MVVTMFENLDNTVAHLSPVHTLCAFPPGPMLSGLVLFQLDYGNATLAGLPAYLLSQLQAIMNTRARLTFNDDRSEHITPLLCLLHWLCVPDRITFKLVTLMLQCVSVTAHGYLSSNVQRVANVLSSIIPIVFTY